MIAVISKWNIINFSETPYIFQRNVCQNVHKAKKQIAFKNNKNYDQHREEKKKKSEKFME